MMTEVPEPNSLAERLEAIADPNFPGVMGYTAANDLRAAAVELRRLEADNRRLRSLCEFLIDACAEHRIPVPLNSELLDLAAEIAGGCPDSSLLSFGAALLDTSTEETK